MILDKNIISFYDLMTSWESLQGIIENYEADFINEMYIEISILKAAQHQIQTVCDRQHPGVYERIKPWANTQS